MNQALDSLCGEGNWVCYVINLKRSTDRKESVQKFADFIGLSVNFWEATDKLTLTQDDYKEADVVVNGHLKSDGATACRLSHHRLSKYLLKQYPNHQYFFILEDDLGFVGDQEEKLAKKERLVQFCKLVKDKKYRWDQLLFYSFPGMRQSIPISDQVCIYTQTHGNVAVLLHRKQVELHVQILETDHPQMRSLPCDWTIDILRRQKLGVCLAPINNLVDHIDNGFSFIWN